MSTPGDYYRSLPPVSKTYGVACLMTTAALYLGLYNHWTIALEYELVFKRFQVWRLITNFFFLGPFSFPFAFRLIIIAKYGVSLERGPFDKRTADYVWMFIFGALSLLVMAAIPPLYIPFMGPSLVFMIVYIWGREFPNARISIYGVVSLKGFYLPWALLALNLIFGNPLMPDILGMVAGHLYYFLTVLHPLAGGRNLLKTPRWANKVRLLILSAVMALYNTLGVNHVCVQSLNVRSHKVVAYWGEGFQVNAPVPSDPSAGIAFRGRSHRLGGMATRGRSPEQAQTRDQGPVQQPMPAAEGVAFRGRSYRLGGR
ncbi:hypothetical protein EUGRSUZ_A02914 [Eucalyptus grandis]|uniref:Uncharacterized protein n=2 Tax=Eucalyptus grandis TaxID=71139 RepID=A0ACC3M8X1_EUCGR|nr:hypothetical protein EUGRSUZ_A02914 [Eucalyptus grandis]